MDVHIPQYAEQILARLRSAGFEACLVGGCVRDALAGRRPLDWDIATSALPQQAKEALEGIKTFDTGLKHGTITALLDGNRVEITTFRADGEYLDGRRPQAVTLGAGLESDLARRDFTINAMAFSENGLIDPFGGRKDLQNRVIRAVGDPNARFAEDGLRILRALRFSALLGFQIEPKTALAARQLRRMLEKVAFERIRDELLKLLEGEWAALVLGDFSDIFAVFLPEIEPTFGFDQRNKHHHLNVWRHTLAAVDAAPRRWEIRLALLLHDLAKPLCYSEDAQGTGHFYGHAARGFELAHSITRRLRLGGEEAEFVCLMVKYHDTDLLASEKSVKRWLAKLGGDRLRALIAIKRADNLAQSPEYRGRQRELDDAERLLEDILARRDCFSLKSLAVRGGDFVEMGARGAKVGEILNFLLERVIDGDVQNQKDALLKAGRALLWE